MLKKKNIAMAMAAATVVTAAPAYAAPVQREVVDNTQEKEIKELKAEVLEKFNTKYTKNEALQNNATAGECAYKITMNEVEYTKYADFEAAFDKAFAKLQNGQKITVNYLAESVRVLEDGTVVDFKDDKYTVLAAEKEQIDINDSYFTTELGGIVLGNTEDGKAYAKVPVSDGYITVKEEDTKLNLEAPIFKVVDGNYVDADGNAIKVFDEKSVVKDAKTVLAKGGVIEGYYRAIGEGADKDSGVVAIVKNASSTQKEDATVADLYEASTDRLTKKGNELRKVLASTVNKETEDVTKDTTLVKSVFGINKAGEVCELNDANLAEIKVVFEERKNEISEWTPVYEMTITEARNHEFQNVIDHILNGDDTEVDVAAGLDRYQTSVELSKQGWNDGELEGGTVVLVSGANDKLVDGLTATPLAAQLEAPVLLTKKDSVPSDVIDEIERLKAKNVYIVGGESAVSKEVSELLTKKYGLNVTRLSGDSRYETSLVVAEEIAKDNKDINQIFVVGGKGEADALSASAVAAYKGSPILLTPAGDLDKGAEGFIKANLKDGNEQDGTNDYIDIFVVGGETSVSKKVQSQLVNIPGNDFEVKRLAGEGRQETNAAVIDEFAELYELDNVVVGKSNNAALVDSLSAGAYAAKTNSHIVLATNELTDSQEDALNNLDTKKTVAKKTQAGYGIAEKVAKFIKGLEK